MGGYLVARWVLLPIALILLPILWGFLVTFLRAFGWLFSDNQAQRAAASEYFRSLLMMVGLGAIGVGAARFLPEDYFLPVAALIAAGALGFSWLTGRRAQKQTEEEIDEMLARMRRETPPQR